MQTQQDDATKIHYICQTYVDKNAGSAKPANLQVDKLIEYTSASAAQERAEREARAENCAGADAYMLIEDAGSGEVSLPDFLGRYGNVPDAEMD